MRVLAAVVVPPHLTVSGAARAAESLSLALAARCDMAVATMIGDGSGGPEGAAEGAAKGGNGSVRRVLVRTSLPWPLRPPQVPKRVKTLFYRSDIGESIRTGRYDLVHIHNPMPALEMRRIARVCRSHGIPYVVSTHGFNEIANGLRIYAFGPAQRAVWRRLVLRPVEEVVRGAHGIFALSADDLGPLQALGHSGDNVTIVSNGVGMPGSADRREEERLLARFGIGPKVDDASPTFLFLANHTPNKGLPVLLDAFRRLDGACRLIVGGERRPDIDYDRHLAACRPDQKIVVTGRLTDAEAAACFRRADIFVFPTLADTFPLVVLEAMANGLPVIASRVGGIPHQISGREGILVEPGAPVVLAQAMQALMTDGARIRRLGSAASVRTASEFTWEAAARIAFGGYQRVLAGDSAAKAADRRPSRRQGSGEGAVSLR